jgi:hypothetical protein
VPPRIICSACLSILAGFSVTLLAVIPGLLHHIVELFPVLNHRAGLLITLLASLFRLHSILLNLL